MADNPNKPWNLKRYDTTSRESAIGFVNDLMMRNEDAAQKYREAAALADEDSTKEYLESLSRHRQALYQELYEWMDALPPTPMPVNKRVRSELHHRWEEFQEALKLNQESKIADIVQASERELKKQYREATAQKGIPVDIHDMMNEQHKHILEVLRKVERMDIVPMRRNNKFNPPEEK